MWDALENRAPAEKKAAAVQRKNVARSLMSLFKRGCGASVSAFSASSPHHLSGRPGKMMGGKVSTPRPRMAYGRHRGVTGCGTWAAGRDASSGISPQHTIRAVHAPGTFTPRSVGLGSHARRAVQ